MSNNIEYRSFGLNDVVVDKEKRTIVGRSLPYNSMSNELRTTSGDTFREVILPGSITDSLANNDILAYKEHDPAMLLGRKSAGTLKLEDRSDGVYCEIEVPDTTYGNDLLVSAARGDIAGFSFGFNNPKARNYTRSGQKIREIYSMNLREVSVVSSPAYSATTLALRSEEFVEEKPETKVEEVKTISPEKDEAYKLKQRFYDITQK